MQFGDAVRVAFALYATFSGRASRSEFWYFSLFVVVLTAVVAILDRAIFPAADVLDGPLFWAIWVVTLLPSIAVTSRRLHDCDKNGVAPVPRVHNRRPCPVDCVVGYTR